MARIAAPASREAEIVARLARVRLVPVLTVDDADAAHDVARALLEAGLPCLEIAFRTEAAASAVERVRSLDGLLVGAGTILGVEDAERAAAAGADFAVAPGLDEDVFDRCRALGLPFFPGAATPTEIGRAAALGATTAKLFPAAALGGPGFVAAVSAVYPDMRFIPTGGIQPEQIRDYLALPSVVACAGSWLRGTGEMTNSDEFSLARVASRLLELAG